MVNFLKCYYETFLHVLENFTTAYNYLMWYGLVVNTINHQSYNLLHLNTLCKSLMHLNVIHFGLNFGFLMGIHCRSVRKW